MMYNYKVEYADGTVVKNVNPMTKAHALEQMGKEIQEHFAYGDSNVSVVSAKLVGVN